MARKSKADVATTAASEDTTSTARRSTRIAEKPAAAAPPPKKAAAPRKKRTAEKTEGEDKEEPAAKKPKADSEAEEKAEAKPASKPSSKAAAKPTSKAKPVSKAKKAEEAKHPEPIPEEKEDVVMEDKENHKEEPSNASPEAEVKELHIGDKLPDWTFKNEKGEEVAIASLAGEKGLVIFLVPKADTPGCNTQACGFRDSYEEFEKLHYAVFALSTDAPTAQAKWQSKKNLQYSLLSDPDRKLISALGAGKSKTSRSHVVFEKGSGKLIEKKINVKPAESPKDALEFVKKHHA